MNRIALFQQLHRVVTGKPDKISATVKDFEGLNADIGLRKAKNFLKTSERGQENCTSDWAYWAWAGDIALATTMIAIFEAIKRGVTEFPKIPDLEGKVLMDKIAYIRQWADSL